MGAKASAHEHVQKDVVVKPQAAHEKTIPVLAMPHQNAPVIGRIPCGDQAKLITDNGHFMRVSWNDNDLTGWVDRQSINLKEETAQAAVAAVKEQQERQLARAASEKVTAAPAPPQGPPQALSMGPLVPVRASHPAMFPEGYGKVQAYSRGAVQPALLQAAWTAAPEARLAAAEQARAVVATPRLPPLQVVLKHSGGHPVVPVFAGPSTNAVSLGEVPSGQCAELLAETGDFLQVRWNHVQGWVQRADMLDFAVPNAISMIAQVPMGAPAAPQGPTLNQLNTCTTMEQSNARKEAMERATVPELPREVASIFAHLSTLPSGHGRTPAF